MKPLAQNTLIQNRYLIVHLIGKGGMGEVYLAVDQRLGSAVALKRTFFAGDEMLGNAFEREARTLARMRHPVLPKVSDHFGENEEQYLVMEHISGDDLAKRLELAQKPFPVSWVLFWADQLLDALSYLHTHEPPIIHRDIKPQNLKLTDENHIILLDFGLSKTSTGQTNISQSGSTGSVVGYTPHYAPMEQIRGIGTSARSDLYSLSATLYQLMTNTIPVDALSRADSMLNEMPDPIQPPSKLNPEIPQVVSDVVLKGMEVSQEKRYPDAREMQKVLRKAFNEIQQATTAKTIAFSIGDEERAAVNQPDAAVLAPESSKAGVPINQSPVELEIPAAVAAVSIPRGDNDAPLDLEATMAYDAAFPAAPVKQGDVKTEIFLAGDNSLPVPENQSFETPAASPDEIPAKLSADTAGNLFKTNDHPSPGPTSDPAGHSPDATVPFISIGREANESHPEAAAEQETYGNAATSGEPFSTADVPYFETPPSEPDVRPEPAAYSQGPAATAPGKKSSKTMLAVVGGLVALFLLAVVVAGGVWAYVNYGAGVTETEHTPSPSPEVTPETSPSPESTPDAVFGSNNSSGADPGNTNANNEVPTVSPTPVPTPVTSSTTTTRPPPQSVPTPVRPDTTPKDRPTPKPKKTPVARPTVLQ